MTKVYAQFYMGQGGYIFSLGIPQLAKKANALGITTDVYRYVDYNPGITKYQQMRAAGYKTALIGYSLGNTTTTLIQTYEPTDLLCAIAQSSLAGSNNRHINKKNTKRSVLWYGYDVLSDGGVENGFDVKVYLPITHLWFDFDSRVVNGVLKELTDLRNS